MAWDDPVVWILILGVAVLLFGASRIPKFARSIGEAKREFQDAMKPETTKVAIASYAGSNNGSSSTTAEDPLMQAAQREGIDTQGKTREQLATELSWKLSRK